MFLEASTLGLGAVIGGLVTLPVLGFTIGPAFLKQGVRHTDLGPIDDYPEGEYLDHDVRLERGGRRLAPNRVHPQQRLPRRPAELHDPLQPLRPSRLPGRSRTASRSSSRRRCTGGVTEDPGEPVRLRLPVPRRAVRHRGKPDRRPAGARRSTATRSRSSTATCIVGKPFSVVDGRRHGRRREDLHRDALVPGRVGAAGPSPGSTRSSPLTDGSHEDARRSGSSTRSTGSRSGRASSARSGTSSSGRSPRTSTGSRRSARRR